MSRIRIVAALATALCVAAPAALADKTTGKYPACGKELWLEAMLEFRDKGQDQAYDRWLNQGRCIELREGLDVEVIRYYGDAEHKRVEFEINGFRFFTVRKAIAQAL
jgi:hypothetical protein